jgi:small-conductance mechanosensitive channel
MLLTQRVDNLSLSDSRIAVQCTYTLSLDADINQVQALLCQSALQSEAVLRDPPPQALLNRVDAAGLEFSLVCWLGDPELGLLKTRSQINIAAFQALRAAGIEPPLTPQEVFRHAKTL